MATTGRIVIVGGGLAAATCVTTLRELGHDGDLLLVGAEGAEQVSACAPRGGAVDEAQVWVG